MKYSDTYKWSINLGTNSREALWVRIWIGDTNWDWTIRHPFKIVRTDTLKIDKHDLYVKSSD